MSTQAIHRQRITLPSGDLAVELSLKPPPRRQHVGTNYLAVLLHPWSWLGGRMDDPVLTSFTALLHTRNFHVLHYNGRGVGNSSGWPSLSGLQEAQDLQEVVQWALSYVPHCRRLLLLGYSHGSLISSLHPVLQPPVSTAHVLLSYPLDKRSLLTFFRSKHYASALTSLVQNPGSNVLLVFGDRDQFTSIQSYERWVDEVSLARAETPGREKGRLEVVKVPSADHFWGRDRVLELHQAVADWLDLW